MQPLFASEITAAKLLDMKRTQFVELVKAGSLPPPCSHDRWDVAELQAIMRGDRIRPNQDIEI